MSRAGMALPADLTQPEPLASPAQLESSEKRLRTLPGTPIISLIKMRHCEAPEAGPFPKCPGPDSPSRCGPSWKRLVNLHAPLIQS